MARNSPNLLKRISNVGKWLASGAAIAYMASFAFHDDDREITPSDLANNDASASATFDEVAKAYADDQIAIQELFSSMDKARQAVNELYDGHLYNPFIVTRMADNPEYKDHITTITHAALMYGINPVLFTNQMYRECKQFDKEVIEGEELSSAGAVGCAQFMPGTAAEYGFTTEDMSDFETAMHVSAAFMADLTDKNGGDQILAMMEYNGGQGLIAFLKDELGDNFSGEDALTFLNQRHNDDVQNGKYSPSAWHEETRKYIETIIYGETSYDHQELARDQQYGGLPPNMLFAGAIIAEHHQLISAKHSTAIQVPDRKGVMGPEVDLPKRPRSRPDSLGQTMAEATSPEQTASSNAPESSPRPRARPKDLAKRTASLDNG